MIDVLTIEKIKEFIDEKSPELNETEKLYCFSKLYSSFGSMSYDDSNTETMMRILDSCLKEIKPKEIILPRISLWEPRWKDNVCLLSKFRIPDGPVEIEFTRVPAYRNKVFEVDGRWVKENCSLTNNGRIPCYAVPMEALNEKTFELPDIDIDR